MLAFWIIGGIGAALFLLSMIVGDILDGLFDSLDGISGGLLSTASVAGFAGAFGLAGGTFMAVTNLGFGLAVIVGLVAGILMGALSMAVTKSVANGPTDRAPKGEDLIGAAGVVITDIATGSMGQVSIQVGGHRLKFNARADQPLPSGASVVVTQSLSATSVRVTAA